MLLLTELGGVLPDRSHSCRGLGVVEQAVAVEVVPVHGEDVVVTHRQIVIYQLGQIIRAGNKPSQSCTITEKAPIRTFSWLKALSQLRIYLLRQTVKTSRGSLPTLLLLSTHHLLFEGGTY